MIAEGDRLMSVKLLDSVVIGETVRLVHAAYVEGLIDVCLIHDLSGESFF